MAGAEPGVGGGVLAIRPTLDAGKASIPRALGAFSKTINRYKADGKNVSRFSSPMPRWFRLN